MVYVMRKVRLDCVGLSVALGLGQIACATTIPDGGNDGGSSDAGASVGDSADGAGGRAWYYTSNCPNSPSCFSPRESVEIPSSLPRCQDLNIRQNDPCSPGAAPCVARLGLRYPDGGDMVGVCKEEVWSCIEGPIHVGLGRLCKSSSAAVKKQIHYLTPEEVTEAAQEIRNLPLVRYRYKSQGDDATPTVGIVIEDVPGASFVERENRQVNLYSFVSATAAAYQAQAKEIEVLKARLSQLEASCGRSAPPPGGPRPGQSR